MSKAADEESLFNHKLGPATTKAVDKGKEINKADRAIASSLSDVTVEPSKSPSKRSRACARSGARAKSSPPKHVSFATKDVSIPIVSQVVSKDSSSEVTTVTKSVRTKLIPPEKDIFEKPIRQKLSKVEIPHVTTI